MTTDYCDVISPYELLHEYATEQTKIMYVTNGQKYVDAYIFKCTDLHMTSQGSLAMVRTHCPAC